MLKRGKHFNVVTYDEIMM